MLKSILRLLFGSPRPRRAAFHDVVLGEMTAAECGWTVAARAGEDSFKFTIGGIANPDAALLAHAHSILNDFDKFKKVIKAFIEAESCGYPADVKAEVAGLVIDDVCLFWPHRPDDGMIFFRGRNADIGQWRCDYVARKPTGLGCDT